MVFDTYRQVWLVDFEFHQPAGELPSPICLVALELRSGATIRLDADELRRRRQAPFAVGPDSLVVAYFAVAEMNCFRALGWQMPLNLLDLYVEFSNNTNGLILPAGKNLLGALVYHGLSAISCTEKQAMRDLAIRGGPYTHDEMRQLLEYCEADVRALQALVQVMSPIDLPRALLRGRYIRAVSGMETTGIPIDMETLSRLKENWETIKAKLINQAGHEYTVRDPLGGVIPVYDGTRFKAYRFERFLEQNDITWPRLRSGALDLTDDTFRLMAKAYPRISELRELRHALSQLRLTDLAVGKDGRNRSLLSPFRSKTGRNQPSTSRFIFGSSVWLRGLIKPEPARAVAYIDWSGQEYGIAAALSGDEAMMADYQSGDPYLTFAIRLGVVPAHASKGTCPDIREAFKVALGLGAMYGAGANTVATMIGRPPAYADYILREHRVKYSRFWEWRDAVAVYAMITGQLQTVFGWTIHVTDRTNPRSLSNFPMQANGAEMMRLACIYVTEAGINLCAPIHDALLIEGPAEEIDEIIAQVKRLMAKASRIVLNGFELRTGVEKVVYPDRCRDHKRGGPMWDRVMSLLPY